jgi:type IV pilus assembly protein PilC
MNKAARTLRFFQMLSALLGGSANLIDAVDVLCGKDIEKPVRETAVKAMGFLKKGGGFADALAYASDNALLFPDMYRGLMRSAERTGKIDAALAGIAGDLERKIKAREMIAAAMAYPLAVVLLALGGTAALIYKGIPFFTESGILPGVLLAQAAGSVLFAGTFLLSAGVLLAVGCYNFYVKESEGFHIFYELSFLLEGGISLPESLSHCIMSAGENKWGRALAFIKKDITEGKRVALAFEDAGVFPAYITGWLNIGDKNGEITTACRRIKEYYQARDNKRREMVIRFIEPLFIVVTGVYLLILIQGIILPILTRAGGII